MCFFLPTENDSVTQPEPIIIQDCGIVEEYVAPETVRINELNIIDSICNLFNRQKQKRLVENSI